MRSLAALLFALAFAGAPGTAGSAVILVYHHVASGTPPATSVSPAQFLAQLAFLDDNGFAVRPLLEILGTLRAGGTLPHRTVALTFDDGYRSLLETAAPALEQRGWPYTIFITSSYIDDSYSNYLTWRELLELTNGGATIGNHTLSHPHLVRRQVGESAAAHQERVRQEITTAQQRLAAELPAASLIRAVAYPYGEYDDTVARVVDALGFYGIGQHSGAIGVRSDWLAVPRYAIAGSFAGLDAFVPRVLSRPLDLVVEDPRSTINTDPDGRPALRMRIPDELPRAAELACYGGMAATIDVERDQSDTQQIIVRPTARLSPGRTRINCTVPHASESGVFLWFSRLWLTPAADGSWYPE